MNGLDRRTFLRHASLAAGSTLLLSGTKASGRAIGANNRLRIAVAGLNGRGRNHISGWLGSENVEIAYLADVDERVRASAVESVNKKVNGAYKCPKRETFLHICSNAFAADGPRRRPVR